MRILSRRLVVVLAAVALLAVAPAAMASAPATPASSAGRTPPVPGAQRFEGGWAVPLSTTAPGWFDKAFYDQIVAAGDQGVRVPAGVSMPAAAGMDAMPGIHPGLWLITLLDQGYLYAWCSANFVFVKSGTYGLGTAGHCAGRNGISPNGIVTAFVVPPPGSGKLPGFYAIGKFVLSHNNGIGDDFAMISIYPQYNSWVRPTMPLWGGPTGIYRANTPTEVNWVGNAAGFGATGTARSGLAPLWYANSFAWYGPSFEGDSGAGVQVGIDPSTTGVEEAAGDLTHLVILDGSLKYLPGMMAGTRMSKILSIATGWTLVKGNLVGVTAP
ncbi:MAG: hypothetical protein QOG64_2062 [Acidimicrobiaceae bacterium]|jgi:hypothetical protein|nr:hypothetical protein [Acidimicrobiaceae bacterium]